ncbi:MAG: endonuclease III domain-containing protein [Candidatus Kerfeldbacteria bacterium]|nr:endonuclease III domain-containing protein [Candidatus Kerfeldbacteria bacterium]
MNFLRLYGQLRRQYGPQQWWPAKTRGFEARCLEICVGAILTQNTNWKNVEKALENLRHTRLLSLEKLLIMPRPKLATLIRPSGYYNQKAIKLQAFATFMKVQYGGSFRRMFIQPTMALRQQLVAVHGIGKETADSMLLYAGGKSIFVIDTYTKRMLAEHGIVFRQYDEYRQWFEKRLPRKVKLFQEFHALMVAWGKDST